MAKLDLQSIRTVRNWIPILMLHEVVPDRTDPLPAYAITQSRLRGILRDFTERGYRAGTLEDVVDRLDGTKGAQNRGEALSKQLVLTFDDGTRDFLEYALPVLQEFDFIATVFIVAGMVGGKRVWSSLPGQPQLTPVPLMSAGELRTLHSSGVTIGSHTVFHRPLSGLNTDDARLEITVSRQMLRDLLGSPVRWFAYPYLAANKLTRALVREAGYEGACGGPHQKHSRFHLCRIDASLYTTPQLRLRCNGLYQMTRLAVRRARQAIS